MRIQIQLIMLVILTFLFHKIDKGTAGLINKSCLLSEPLARCVNALRTNETGGTHRGDVLSLHLSGGES